MPFYLISSLIFSPLSDDHNVHDVFSQIFLRTTAAILLRAVRQAASTEQLSECYAHTLARSEWRCCAGRRACRSHRRPEIALGSTPPDTEHPRREHPPVRVQLQSTLVNPTPVNPTPLNSDISFLGTDFLH